MILVTITLTKGEREEKTLNESQIVIESGIRISDKLFCQICKEPIERRTFLYGKAGYTICQLCIKGFQTSLNYYKDRFITKKRLGRKYYKHECRGRCQEENFEQFMRFNKKGKPLYTFTSRFNAENSMQCQICQVILKKSIDRFCKCCGSKVSTKIK